MNLTVIFGAPGCGKTRALLDILEKELETVPPEEIAFVSFTRKGTKEGTQRAAERFGLREERMPHFRTLHSMAFRAGGFSKHQVVSRADYREFSEAMGMKFTGYYTPDFSNTQDDKYLFAYFLRKNNPKAFENFPLELDSVVLSDVERNYDKFKKHANVVDFTDMLEVFAREKKSLPVRVAIIDEAQDLTTLQWDVARVAFAKAERIYVAGDDDQAIYEWSGADVERFLGLKGERKILTRSWRLPTRVLETARRVSSQITHRVEKEFSADDREGEVFVYNSLEEIEIDPSRSWYFLSRNNWFLSKYRADLRRRALPFSDKGTSSVDSRSVEAINAHERRRRGEKLDEAQEMKLKALEKPGSSPLSPWYETFDLPVDDLAYLRDLVRLKRDPKLYQTLLVDTIHGVKGGEADDVVVLMDFTRGVRENMERNPDAELRCLYVALTRAKHRLHLVHSSSRSGYDNYLRLTT